MRPVVTELTHKRAFATIQVVARAILGGERVLTYSDLATRLGMPNETGQGLGPILDAAAATCEKHGMPNVSSVVVTKESVERGKPFPSLQSFDDDGSHPSGLSMDDVPAEQERVRAFDWRSKPSLGLSRPQGSQKP